MNLQQANNKLWSKKKTRNNRLLVTYRDPSSKISEEYRTIRTNLKFTPTNKKYQSLVVTSPSQGEGKSSIVANLGVSLSQQGEKVLIVDANLRRPALHSIFKVDNSIGLTNFLNRISTLEMAIQRTGIGRLDVLTSGPIPKNPAELLDSIKMNELMDTVIENYDVILYDTAPVLEVTDTNIFASRSDGVILVLVYGRTENELAIESKRVLEQSKARIIGTILNEKT
ncbi:polysaccharide biosynthesis tyrosine autokinase [Robertmurraya yapensis]|uniref:non-specific protein-tyrosine kinase n=2 Tax=Bacillaceae TaxID=186817 RepID=A0A3S0L990_9BACI|nr:CpsD/CapB family tyrosine-protein kinase [Bacillus yapensis]RTR30024.1 polysaccharide biosynthesis tyrosine autokinase [Bacillus yapensis]TKS95105.1 polysaccharide biosynthesis tyrosine autokinase [Bacillus yapensis]